MAEHRRTLIENANIVNEGQVFRGYVLVEDGHIAAVTEGDASDDIRVGEVIDASGLYLLPGVIDDQVHFREPGHPSKGDIASESAAAVAGGVTSFMDMPNNKPPITTVELLQQKYERAAECSLANYSFYFGATNDNAELLNRLDKGSVCGVKVFMGSSTGNMLVDKPDTLEKIFKQSELPVAVHCEDEASVREQTAVYRQKYGHALPFRYHSAIRSSAACFKSSSLAVELARKFGTRLHLLHLSTAAEMALLERDVPLQDKLITAEACVHHLWFTDVDYEEKGGMIKWNPSVKTPADRDALWAALLDDRLDIIATDHAPHTLEEKQEDYFNCPSGGPLVQHSLVAMLECHLNGKITLEQLVEKMCHAPAVCFNIAKRGFIRKGYWADLVLVDMDAPWEVGQDNVLYKCGWSPFEGQVFRSRICATFVNGQQAYHEGKVNHNIRGQRLRFNR